MVRTTAQTGQKQAAHTDRLRAKSVKDTKQKSYDAAALNASDGVRGTSCFFWPTRDQILLNESKYAEDCLPTPYETSVERSLREEHWHLRSAESGQA